MNIRKNIYMQVCRKCSRRDENEENQQVYELNESLCKSNQQAKSRRNQQEKAINN
jgi:hypothetical protein